MTLVRARVVRKARAALLVAVGVLLIIAPEPASTFVGVALLKEGVNVLRGRGDELNALSSLLVNSLSTHVLMRSLVQLLALITKAVLRLVYARMCCSRTSAGALVFLYAYRIMLKLLLRSLCRDLVNSRPLARSGRRVHALRSPLREGEARS